MYDFIRKIHLYVGFFILVFVLMYTVSGIVMVRGKELGYARKIVTDRTEPLTYQGDPNPDVIASHIQEKFALGGRIDNVKSQQDGSLRFNVRRPGTAVEASMPANGETVTLKTTQTGWRGILNDMHRVHGYKSGSWLFNIFIALSDATAVALMLFAFTGVYLWWKTAKQKVWGVLCLLFSFGYATSIVLYLVYAK